MKLVAPSSNTQLAHREHASVLPRQAVDVRNTLCTIVVILYITLVGSKNKVLRTFSVLWPISYSRNCAKYQLKSAPRLSQG
jgi:hypothetical protein